jgi:thiol-disulfide isomerase/thioredoxin
LLVSAISIFVSAAAKSKLATALPNLRVIGHFISFFITLPLMIVVCAFAVGWKCKGVKRRQRKYKGKNCFVVYGPFILTIIAAPLILADQTRHVLSDMYDLTGFGWAWCGDNPVFPRVNETFPSSCTWSSTQFVCNQPCCVPLTEAVSKNLPYGSDTPAVALAPGEVCECDCLPSHEENMLHLSMIGIIFTVICTYSGFILLAVGALWNADIINKCKKMKKQWQSLRSTPVPTGPKAVHKPKSLAEFKQFLADHKNVVVDCSASFCAPCKVIFPEFERIATSTKSSLDLEFVKIETDMFTEAVEDDVECEEDEVFTAGGAGAIESWPVFLFYSDNAEIASRRIVGVPEPIQNLQTAITAFVDGQHIGKIGAIGGCKVNAETGETE